MAKRLIIKNITACYQCPYREWDEVGACSFICTLAEGVVSTNVLNDLDTLPDWCPLEEDK